MEKFNLIDYCLDCFVDFNNYIFCSLDELNLVSFLVYSFNYFNYNVIYDNNVLFLLYSIIWYDKFLEEIVEESIYTEDFIFNLILDNSHLLDIQMNIFGGTWEKNHFYANSTLLEEYDLVFSSIISSDYLANNVVGKLNLSIYHNILFSKDTYVMDYIFDLLYTMIFIYIVYIVYFTYFNNNQKNDNLVEFDNFNNSLQNECEKELGSLDDVILGLVNVMFLFGWFFYINIIFINNSYNDMICLFFALPAFYYIIFSIPSYLLYDFGILFTTYLRGSSNTKLLIFELFYDYIAIFIYFLRLLVQGVRFLLMFITFCSLHDMILFNGSSNLSFIGHSQI